ncbi:hypothetical protein AGATL06_26320 [Agathobaculum sp. TL06]
MVMIGANGDRNFIVKRGACDSYTLADIDPMIYGSAKILNIGSVYTFKKLFGKDMAKLLHQAQMHGMITTADAMYDSYQIGAEKMRPAMQYLDYFLPSYDEAKYLTGETEPDKMADALLDYGVQTVVIKMGEKGCLLKNRELRLEQPAFHAPAVDTTGAGDNFIAGFLHGILNQWDLEKCLLFASATAAISIGAIGATGAVQSAQQVLDWLKEKHITL